MKKINHLGVNCRVPLELKNTVNLPKTGFPMKANLPQNEPKLLARWEEIGIYERTREARKGDPAYILHDGPPYANGALHLGHALNKCLKDFIVKSKNMAGFDAPYVPGWDCHGLTIEIKVDQQLGKKKLQMNPSDVRLECRKYAEKFLNLQREQFKRIGCFGRWDRPYSTMTPEYESVVLHTFYDFLEKGFVYKGLRSVYWCIHDQTALAEAEVEYENHVSPTVWVKYALKDDPAQIDPALKGKDVSTIIWTTTPWTLPASMAVAFHPDEEYVALESGKHVFIVGAKLANQVIDKCKLAGATEVARFPGRVLERRNFQHPFLDRNILGVLADYVTMDTGTGVVHTAPSHGAEDFITGLKYNLDATTRVDEAGFMREGLPEYDNKKVWEANAPIVDLLQARGVLLHTEPLEHSYPHCWRCHNPIIFRATPQWFIAMDRPLDATEGLDATLRSKALSEIDHTVTWVPDWGRTRIRGMVENRPDWCISRQRTWGVPIPVLLCDGCGESVVSPELMERVADAVEKDGTGIWYSAPLERFAPPGLKCEACGGTALRKETDILDVWFDSACAFAAVSERWPDMGLPGDLYLEGSDQHRGWFQSSLLVSVASRGNAPYREVLTAGFVVDGEGRKMSKSVGNTVKPEKLIQQSGAEIVRLWVAAADYHDDVRLSESILRNLSEGYRKIRNTLRYALSNLYDFDPAKDAVPEAELLPLDRLVLARLDDVVGRVRRAYDEYEFHLVYHALVDFCGSDLSAVHFDISKDRLYTWKAAGHARRSAQTVLHRILLDVTRLLAPVTSFTAEEVWEYLPGRPAPSVFLAGLPEATGRRDPALMETFDRLFSVRAAVQQQLEAARRDKLIGSSLEAKVVLHADAEGHEFLARHLRELPQLLIVSQVVLEAQPTERMVRTSAALPGAGHLGIEVRKADGAKCPRCWTYAPEVAAGAEVCPKFQEALS